MEPPDPGPEPRKLPLVERAYREIKARILGNRYPANLQVLEQELALELGMSRTPVREALIRLEREGLVEILPRRGMRVLPISARDMGEIYEVLTALEGRAAERLAASRPSAEALAPLTAALERMERALAAGELVSWAEADGEFHRGLVELAGNRRLARMAATVSDQVHRARMATLGLRPAPQQSNRDHRALIDAILEGDSARARTLHEAHRERARQLLTEILERHDLSAL